MRHDSIRRLRGCTLTAVCIVASSLVRPHPLVARRRPHASVLDEQVGHMNRRHRLLRHGQPHPPLASCLALTPSATPASKPAPRPVSPPIPDAVDPPAPALFAPSVPASIPPPPSSWQLHSLLANGVVEDRGTTVDPAASALGRGPHQAPVVNNTLMCLAQITKS